MKHPILPLLVGRKASMCLASIGLLLGANAARALTFTSAGASADFSIVSGDLRVTLTNTAASGAADPTQVLTAVFFSLGGNPALTPLSAVLAGGSTIVNGTTPLDGVVGGEWAYLSGISAPGGASAGISSSGLGGLFGNPNFPGPDLEAPTALNGLNYGVVSNAYVAGTGNGGVSSTPLIRNSVVFTLSGVTDLAQLPGITNVSFQYGTALTEPNVPGTPGGGPGVPDGGSTILLCGIAFSLLGFAARAFGRSAK